LKTRQELCSLIKRAKLQPKLQKSKPGTNPVPTNDGTRLKKIQQQAGNGQHQKAKTKEPRNKVTKQQKTLAHGEKNPGRKSGQAQEEAGHQNTSSSAQETNGHRYRDEQS
jgi:hypothetical protein